MCFVERHASQIPREPPNIAPSHHVTLPLAPTPALCVRMAQGILPSTEDRKDLLAAGEGREENPTLWTQA